MTAGADRELSDVIDGWLYVQTERQSFPSDVFISTIFLTSGQ